MVIVFVNNYLPENLKFCFQSTIWDGMMVLTRHRLCQATVKLAGLRTSIGIAFVSQVGYIRNVFWYFSRIEYLSFVALLDLYFWLYGVNQEFVFFENGKIFISNNSAWFCNIWCAEYIIQSKNEWNPSILNMEPRFSTIYITTVVREKQLYSEHIELIIIVWPCK